jgi:hypothetical protein
MTPEERKRALDRLRCYWDLKRNLRGIGYQEMLAEFPAIRSRWEDFMDAEMRLTDELDKAKDELTQREG